MHTGVYVSGNGRIKNRRKILLSVHAYDSVANEMASRKGSSPDYMPAGHIIRRGRLRLSQIVHALTRRRN